MHRFTTRWHSLMAWLGLLALTLALGGSLLSQTQRLLGAAPATAGASQHVAHHPDHLHQHRAAGAEHAGPHHHAHHHASPGQDELAACDYCTLFLHMPGLLVATNLVLTPPPLSPSPLVAATRRSGEEERYRHYRGRAPPLRSCV
ncbi:DUF2946 family protein [Halomonas sp. MCCC 1A11036]|uniref:DUF2946 family protein n=1 Tax=Billgrantia zhangzhouensis TaxID=2733481 RepID=A0ABS9AFI6_9GAMM|nr:DUF2946 family protein [Halomonas zhangzhouensis]